MRRPINWFVFCLSLAFLFANVTFSRKPAPSVGQAMAPLPARMGFSLAMAKEPATTQFGYVRDDGSFLPMAQQPGIEPDADVETVWSHWSEEPPVASKAPARF
jgi:hypothetical protein